MDQSLMYHTFLLLEKTEIKLKLDETQINALSLQHEQSTTIGSSTFLFSKEGYLTTSSSSLIFTKGIYTSELSLEQYVETP